MRIIVRKIGNADTLNVTIKKYLPIEYRIYKDNKKKSKAIIKDYTKIKNPFSFRFPVTKPGEYYSVKSDYLTDTAFAISRSTLTKFLNEFEYLADNEKIEYEDDYPAGIYCNIEFTNAKLGKKYWLTE